MLHPIGHATNIIFYPIAIVIPLRFLVSRKKRALIGRNNSSAPDFPTMNLSSISQVSLRLTLPACLDLIQYVLFLHTTKIIFLFNNVTSNEHKIFQISCNQCCLHLLNARKKSCSKSKSISRQAKQARGGKQQWHTLNDNAQKKFCTSSQSVPNYFQK